MPKVSICIPTYNREDYLRQAIDSALNQTYVDCEIVVVDDGSTDRSGEIVKSIGRNVRYMWVDHIGQAAARNKLIESARGEYITFLDSDDLLFPDTVERLMNAIETHSPNVFAYGYYVSLGPAGNVLPTKQPKLPSGRITADLFDFIYVKSCGTMCAKGIYEQEGGFDASLTRCAVYKLLLELSLKYDFIPVSRPTYGKRRHASNVLDHSYAGRKTELEVLERFYFGAGNQMIPRRRAVRRLSQEAYRVGRRAMREGLADEALHHLGRSFSMHPNARSLMRWMQAKIRFGWAGARRCPGDMHGQ
jgi:glycosyltransferase involved in cell wall biosynthesis